MVSRYFDEKFLTWFRKTTDKSWSTLEETPLEDFEDLPWAVSFWQRGTHWLDGLNEQEITEIEQKWHLRFPPDYRLFLSMLHSVDRKMHTCGYFDGENLSIKKDHRVSYYNWQTDEAEIQQAYDKVVDGMLFDVRYNNVWWPGWGEKPSTFEEQSAKVRDLIAAAPRLIPIIGHRFLLAEPCVLGNPVLSIKQTDIIVYTPDLYTFFIEEATDLFDDYFEYHRSRYKKLDNLLKQQQKRKRERLPEYEKIPFWGQFVGNHDPFDGRIVRF